MLVVFVYQRYVDRSGVYCARYFSFKVYITFTLNPTYADEVQNIYFMKLPFHRVLLPGSTVGVAQGHCKLTRVLFEQLSVRQVKLNFGLRYGCFMSFLAGADIVNIPIYGVWSRCPGHLFVLWL